MIFNQASGRTVTGTISSNPGANPTGSAATTLVGTSTGLLGSGGPSRAFFIPRGSFRRPYTQTVDLRLSKRFRLTETMNIEFLAEAFNLLNRSNVTSVSESLYTFSGASSLGGTLTFNPTGERVGSFLREFADGINNTTIFTPRQVQLSVRFEF